MTIKPSQRIRKVWLPSEMKAAMQEYCWKHRTKPSPFIAGIIQEIVDHPERYTGVLVPPAGLDYSSVYIDEETWQKGIDTATTHGTRLSAMVRVGIARELETEGIPYHVSTARPRNEYIPDQE